MYAGTHDAYDRASRINQSSLDGCIVTSTGQYWSILSPHPNDVHIADLAAGLSRACRYSGQIKENVDGLPVSEHSENILVAMERDGKIRYFEDAMKVLLHDGSEAFLGDKISPLKRLIPDFKAIEKLNQNTIYQAFGVNDQSTTVTKAEIKEYDNRIRLNETAAAIMDPAGIVERQMLQNETPGIQPLDIEVQGLDPRSARISFYKTVLRCIEAYPAATAVVERGKEKLRQHTSDALSLALEAQQRRTPQFEQDHAEYAVIPTL